MCLFAQCNRLKFDMWISPPPKKNFYETLCFNVWGVFKLINLFQFRSTLSFTITLGLVVLLRVPSLPAPESPWLGNGARRFDCRLNVRVSLRLRNLLDIRLHQALRPLRCGSSLTMGNDGGRETTAAETTGIRLKTPRHVQGVKQQARRKQNTKPKHRKKLQSPVLQLITWIVLNASNWVDNLGLAYPMRQLKQNSRND